MPPTRAAHYTLLGFKYQLQKSAIAILLANDDEPVTLEGVEDIDLGTDEYIQCKYHECNAPHPSVVKGPVVAFLRHAKENPSACIYRLYAHFGQAAATALTHDRVVESVKDEAGKLGYSDDELRTTLATRVVIEEAEDIGNQTEQLHAAIQTSLQCSAIEAQQFFYSRALAEIFRVASQKSVELRTTTRRAFISAINRREYLFRHWISRLQGEHAYVAHIKREADRVRALDTSKWIAILMDSSSTRAHTPEQLAIVLHSLAATRFQVGLHKHNAVPLTLVLEEERQRFVDIKLALLDRGLQLNTGFEELRFIKGHFDTKPVVERVLIKNTFTDTIARSSYDLRVISRASFNPIAASIDTLDTMLVLSGAVPTVRPQVDILHLGDITILSSLVDLLSRTRN